MILALFTGATRIRHESPHKWWFKGHCNIYTVCLLHKSMLPQLEKKFYREKICQCWTFSIGNSHSLWHVWITHNAPRTIPYVILVLLNSNQMSLAVWTALFLTTQDNTVKQKASCTQVGRLFPPKQLASYMTTVLWSVWRKIIYPFNLITLIPPAPKGFQLTMELFVESWVGILVDIIVLNM